MLNLRIFGHEPITRTNFATFSGACLMTSQAVERSLIVLIHSFNWVFGSIERWAVSDLKRSQPVGLKSDHALKHGV